MKQNIKNTQYYVGNAEINISCNEWNKIKGNLNVNLPEPIQIFSLDTKQHIIDHYCEQLLKNSTNSMLYSYIHHYFTNFKHKFHIHDILVDSKLNFHSSESNFDHFYLPCENNDQPFLNLNPEDNFIFKIWICNHKHT